MMKRIVTILALLTLIVVGIQAQGAGLSQGQAVKQTTPNPTTQRKTCPDCGITKGNITYPWQHYTWCPYYRAQGGGSSSKKSSNYGTYTTASAATMAIGSLLSGLISRPKTQTKAATPTSPKIDVAEARADRKRKEVYWERVNRCSTSREYGDYKIVVVENINSDLHLHYNSLCLYNQATGHYLIAPIDGKLLKKGKLPLGTFYYGEGTGLYSSGSNMYFLNSSLLGNSPELDGLLVCERGEVAITMAKGKTRLWGGTYAVYRLSGDSIIPILYQGPVLIEKSKEDAEKLMKANAGYAQFYHESDNVPYHYCEFRPFGSLPYFLGEQPGKSNYNHYALFDQEGKVVLTNSGVKIQQCGSVIYAGTGKVFDLSMNPVFGEYKHHFQPMQMADVGWYFPVAKEEYKKWGLINERGEVIIPCIYSSDTDIKNLFKELTEVSYTRFYKDEAAKYIDKKGEFEKTEHFEARMKDKQMQAEYLQKVMSGAEERYLNKMRKEKNYTLRIGNYDADREQFPIYVTPAPWNSFSLPVPFAEAEAFKTAFDDIKAEALKTAQYGIRYDAPSIEAIRFTMPNGKEYYYGDQ